MAHEIIGRFYFKQTSNGNLIGEFSNNKSEPSTESSDIRGSSDGYIGVYYTTWQENGKPHFADLSISRKHENSKRFSLIWKNSKGETIFKGEGMLCDNILIGDYHNT